MSAHAEGHTRLNDPVIVAPLVGLVSVGVGAALSKYTVLVPVTTSPLVLVKSTEIVLASFVQVSVGLTITRLVIDHDISSYTSPVTI